MGDAERARGGMLAAVVLALVAGVAAWSTGLLDTGPDPDAPPSSSPLDVPPPTGLHLPQARTVRPVLGAPSGPPIELSALRAAVGPLLERSALGRHVGFAAYDLGRERPLWSSGDDETYVPASTLKLLTTAAALAVLGEDHRFETTVTRSAGSGGVPVLTLVGGGDPLLARRRATAATAVYPEPATLAQLVSQTVASMRAADIRRVRLGYDASLFSGPAVSPWWERDYVPDEVVTPISALWVDQGVAPGAVFDRAADPAGAAAEQFAAALEQQGVRVLGQPVESSAAPRARVVAHVDSPPLDQIVQYVLERSDNEGAEVLLRQAALATGRPGSFTGGAATLREVLTGLGIPWEGIRVYDGSGLSRADRLSLPALVGVLRLAADPRHPELRAVVSDLPVARFTGSLTYRFTDPGTEAARGVARAKTGTLSHVHALAGLTVDRSGAQLAFVAVADRVRLRDTLDARDELDRIVAALAACGCSR